MASVRRQLEITARLGSDPTALAHVLRIVKVQGIGLLAYCTHYECQALVARVIADKPGEAMRALEAAGLVCQTNSVIVVELTNQIGAAAWFGKLLSRAGVQILYSYSRTECEPEGNQLCIVFKTTDEARALAVCADAGNDTREPRREIGQPWVPLPQLSHMKIPKVREATELALHVPNELDVLGQLFGLAARYANHIRGWCFYSDHARATVLLVVHNEGEMEQVLQRLSWEYRAHPVIVAEDRDRTVLLPQLANRLRQAGITVLDSYPCWSANRQLLLVFKTTEQHRALLQLRAAAPAPQMATPLQM